MTHEKRQNDEMFIFEIPPRGNLSWHQDVEQQ
jgi:hypothetical protein